MPTNSQNMKGRILGRVQSGPSRKVWIVADFLDPGSRDAIDKAMQRLVTGQTLRRIDRGLYDLPDWNRLTQANNPPDPRSVINAIARRDQIRLLVDGMTAANDLGLTNAIQAKIIVHTDGRLKPIRLGKLEIVFKLTLRVNSIGPVGQRCGSCRRSTGCATRTWTTIRRSASAGNSTRFSIRTSRARSGTIY